MDQPLVGGHQQSAGLRALAFVTAIVCIITLIVSCTLGGILVGRGPRFTDEEKERMAQNRPLPKSYIVPDDVRTPVKNQAHRGTCYIFSTMGILEASYRRNGLAKGFLKENEYVKFCEQAYGLGLIKYCMEENPKDIHCLGGAPTNDTADGQPEWIYYMQDGVKKYVLPDALCPYKWDSDDQYECPGMDEAVKTNPLSFRVKNIESAYSIDGIKRLLYRKEFPLTFSHVVLESTSIVPCDDPNSFLYETDECKTCAYPCTTSSDGCCAKIVVPGYTGEGVFSTYGEYVVGGGHAMVLVGWNDEMAVETGVPGKSAERAVGGFIIKNSWNTTVGHSAEYWAQKHSLLDETAICPNEGSYQTWIPVNTSCMEEKKDVNLCLNDKKHVGTEWIHGPTILKCTNLTRSNAIKYGWTGCNLDMHYLVAGDPETGYATPLVTVPKGSDNVRVYHLVEYNPMDPTYGPVMVQTNATTVYGFERLFQPIQIHGNSDHCGYYFMPYDTFLKSNIINPTYGTDTPAFSYLDIEWDDKSYARGSNDAAYELIKESTHTYAPPKFNGPLDFNNENKL